MNTNTDKIRELNDDFRTNLFRKCENTLLNLSQMVSCLPTTEQIQILDKVAKFNDFNEGNNPHAENDFGKVSYNGQDYFFKIDYYDNDLKYHSLNPADPTQTIRILTIMHVSEY